MRYGQTSHNTNIHQTLHVLVGVACGFRVRLTRVAGSLSRRCLKPHRPPYARSRCSVALVTRAFARRRLHLPCGTSQALVLDHQFEIIIVLPGEAGGARIRRVAVESKFSGGTLGAPGGDQVPFLPLFTRTALSCSPVRVIRCVRENRLWGGVEGGFKRCCEWVLVLGLLY